MKAYALFSIDLVVIFFSAFRNIGYSDQLGSGVRNLFKYTKYYSNGNPELVEGDVFRIIVPLDENYSFDKSIGKSTGKSTGKSIQLNETQKFILSEIQENPRITQGELAKKNRRL